MARTAFFLLQLSKDNKVEVTERIEALALESMELEIATKRAELEEKVAHAAKVHSEAELIRKKGEVEGAKVEKLQAEAAAKVMLGQAALKAAEAKRLKEYGTVMLRVQKSLETLRGKGGDIAVDTQQLQKIVDEARKSLPEDHLLL